MCLRMIMTDSSRMMGLSLARSALDSSAAMIRNKELLLFATLNNVCVCVFVELRILSFDSNFLRSFHII